MTISLRRRVFIVLLSLFFGVAGVAHFLDTASFVAIVPAWLPRPTLLVYLSGAAEILGGMGLLFSASRRVAAWGLILLLVCVLPANVTMAVDHARFPGIPLWVLLARLPFQVPLIWWTWLYTRR